MKVRWVLLGLVVVILLGPAVALTVARAAQPAGGSWVRLVSFTPYAVPLYALAAVLLLVAWLAGGGRWRTFARGLSLVSLLGLALHLWWASGPYVGGPSAAAADQRPFTVMTLNLMLGQASPSQVVAAAVRNDVDVLVLQEVTPQVLTGMEAAGLDKALPNRAGKPADGPAGTMVFSVTKLTDVSPLDTYFGGYTMKVRRPGGPVSLVAVHTRPPIGDAAGWAADHAEVLRASAAAVGPAVVTGDFNATPDHAQMRMLYDEGLTDTVKASTSGWQPTWPASGEISVFGVPVPSIVQIDQVIVSSEISAVRTTTVTLAGTDHRAVIARLRV